MADDAYVILTGAKNNAGDFLIRHRAIGVLGRTRPDRKLVKLDAWKPCGDKELEAINTSRALLLVGGPSLQKDMHPRIYPLTSDLDRIKVPIIMMGVGWKSESGTWPHSRDYRFTPDSLRLINRVAESGHFSSVRDYHSENVLRHHGMTNVVTTGCPALFADESERAAERPATIRSVGFSLGVSFLDSKRMRDQMRDIILKLRDQLAAPRFVVAFHHSLADGFLATHGASNDHLTRHREFAGWLTEQGIEYADISGSAERMIDFYSQIDLHIGYRVHAHILMTSLSKNSILLAEDGRGIALKDVIGKSVIDAIEKIDVSKASKVLARYAGYDRFHPSPDLRDEIVGVVHNEVANGFVRSQTSAGAAQLLWTQMTNFTKQLP